MKWFLAIFAMTGVANAGTCRWTENGTTHFSENCPPGVTVEERRYGGTVPLNSTPAPSLIIEQGQRAQAAMNAREAADETRRQKWRDEARIDRLKKQAKGNGKGLNQSWDELAADARSRRQARDELDNINRQKAGLPPKSDLERRVDRLEKQRRWDRLRNTAEMDEIRRKQRFGR